MADISAIFFILLIIGTAFPAMLTAWWLLFPSLVARAHSRVEKTPWSAFWLGLILMIAVTLPIVILLALPFDPPNSSAGSCSAERSPSRHIGAAGIAAHPRRKTVQTQQRHSAERIHLRRRHPGTGHLPPRHRLALRLDPSYPSSPWA
ncbi:MAG: hypothetical protein M0C28_28685 [Candidatus Moduliflexus flocculans]|nr:hypothetical protein [Candidatus Moduliflexus flocculans]